MAHWSDVNPRGFDHRTPRLLSQLVVALLVLGGTWSLYEGFGFSLPVLNYGLLASYGLPIGAALLFLAALTAKFAAADDEVRG
jgi:hypothetical protein